MSASSYPVLRRSTLSARERLEEATRLRDQAVREFMPKQMIDFLDRKVLEASAEARREEIEELRERSTRLRTAEATPADVETMERYMRARRRGFGSRIAPVPDSLDRADAEEVYGRSVEIRKATTIARKLPPGTLMTTEDLDREMKRAYESQRTEFEKQVMGLLGAVDPGVAARAAELTPRQRDAVRRSAPPKKAQADVAQVSGKRRIALDE